MPKSRKGRKHSQQDARRGSNFRHKNKRRRNRFRNGRSRKHVRKESDGEKLPEPIEHLVELGYHPKVWVAMLEVLQGLVDAEYETVCILARDPDKHPLQLSYGWEEAQREVAINVLKYLGA